MIYGIEMDNIQTKYQDHKSKISGNSLFTTFITSFTETLDKHAPLVKLSKKKMKASLKPWLTQGILKSIKTKNKRYYKCYKQNNSQLVSAYKKYLNVLTKTKRISKEKHYSTLLKENKNNMAKQWSVINEILRKKNKPRAQINKLKTEDNCNITDRKDICNTLNNFFVNVGPTLAKNITSNTPKLASNSIPSNSNSLQFNNCLTLFPSLIKTLIMKSALA